MNENGVDEDLLMKNIDEETPEYVAQQLQDLCDEIDEKGIRDDQKSGGLSSGVYKR